MDENEAEQCIARCNALDLLPKTGVGVLKILADETCAKAADAVDGAPSKSVARARRAAVYRRYYMRWVGHECRYCEPVDWSSSCSSCTRPWQFRWFKNALLDVSFDKFARRIWCPIPPYAPIAYSQAGILDDVHDVSMGENGGDPSCQSIVLNTY